MPSKRKLENRVENLEGEKPIEDTSITIGEGPEKWTITIDTSETSEGQNAE